MAAVAKGFRSRADLGLRQPRSFSRNISPSRGGACPHWGGPASRIRTHADCEDTWRGWQRYHMDTKRWADIAYNVGYCQHGVVLAGRGLGIRSAANGTNDGNQRFHAFVWVGGQGMTPSKDALNALDWLIVNAREHGAGWAVVPHRRFTGSACPGSDLIHHSGRRDGQPIGSEPAKAPEPQEDVMTPQQEERLVASLKRIEGRLDALDDPDGHFRRSLRWIAMKLGANTRIKSAGRELDV